MNHLKRINVKKSIIYQAGQVSIMVEQTVDDSVVNLLKRAIYGTKGPKYQHTGQEVKLRDIKNPLFFSLRKQGDLIGFYCLCEREIYVGNENYLGYYGRYLAVDENHQRNGYGKLLKETALKYVEANSTSPSIMYSYIEENNTRSLNISKNLGFTSITSLETIIFSRLYPKADNQVVRLDEAELPQILQKLEAQNAHTIFRTFENINYQNNYFVIEENGKIVAGLQANPVQWKIVEMGGLSGKFLLKILPHIPILKRLINPNQYDFLAIEGIFIEPDSENLLYPMIEGVLHHFAMTSALFELDSKSQVLKLFKQKQNSGLLNALKKEVKTQVIIKSFHCNVPIPHGESYVSSFDFT